MDRSFGNDFHTISDDDGNQFILEHLDTIEADDTFYLAFLPADMDEDDEDYGLVILKSIEKDGESILATIDDNNKLDELFDLFTARLSEDTALSDEFDQ